MRRLFNKLSYNHDEIWQDAMLEVYQELIQQLARRARLGMHRVVVRPNLKVIGQHYEQYDETQVAEVMSAMLRCEGFTAKVVSRAVLEVSWDSSPVHWVEDN